MSSANVSPSFYTQFDIMKITDNIHSRLHFSVHTMVKQCRLFFSFYRHKYLVFRKKTLFNVGKNLFNSNNSVLWNWNHQMFVFSLTVYSLWVVNPCFQRTVTFISFLFCNLLFPPYCHHSRCHYYWCQLNSSSLCSFIYIKHTSCSVSHPLCWHQIV